MPEAKRGSERAIGIGKPWVLATRAVIRDKAGRWLLLRRSGKSKHFKGTWELPGGKMDAGETIDVTLCREVREETGLIVRPSGVAGITEWEMEMGHVVILYFTTVMEAGELTLSGEHDAFKWATAAELRTLELNPQIRGFFNKDPIHQ